MDPSTIPIAHLANTPSYLVRLSALLLVGSCPGCASLHLDRAYVHDDAAQKAAESAQSAWQTADPTKLFDDQKDYFAKLAVDEAANVKSSIVARRDLQLISLMRGDTGIVPQLRVRLEVLTGAQDAEGRTLAPFAALQEQLSQTRTTLDLDHLELDRARRQFKIDGFNDDVSDCSKIQALPAPTLDQLNQMSVKDADLFSIRQACDQLDASRDAVETILKSGYVVINGKRAGQLGELNDQLISLKNELDAQEQKKHDLEEALAALKEEIDHPKDASVQEFARAALKFCGADPDSSVAADAAAGTPPVAPDSLPKLQTLLPACVTEAGKDIDPLVKLAKHSHLADEIQSALTSILTVNGDIAAGKPVSDPKISAATATSLKTLNFLTETADKIGANQGPSVNALLVGLAYEQHEIAMAKLRAGAVEERIAILAEKREALLNEVSHLARGLQYYGPSKDDGAHGHARGNDSKVAELLNGSHAGAGAILTAVASSWNEGRYRAELADYADIDLTRRSSLAEGDEVVASWKKVLQPALDELVAYGKGGLDAQTLAALATAVINAGGFSAVAARVGN